MATQRFVQSKLLFRSLEVDNIEIHAISIRRINVRFKQCSKNYLVGEITIGLKVAMALPDAPGLSIYDVFCIMV